VAIEEVFIEMNTSIIPDEQLAHRIGLIPIKADPRVFEDRPTCNDSDGMSSVLNDLNTLVFNLDVKCEKNKKYDGTDIDLKYKHAKVYSGNLKWEPVGDQAEMNLGNPGPVQDDILLADLRPGQVRIFCGPLQLAQASLLVFG
jgi:DNA-directed RNA polymerase I and III subunit RPAC1